MAGLNERVKAFVHEHELADEISAELSYDQSLVGADRVDVSAAEGVVTLEGEVDSLAQRWAVDLTGEVGSRFARWLSKAASGSGRTALSRGPSGPGLGVVRSCWR